MNTAKNSLLLSLCLLVSACATPSAPPVTVIEKLPPLTAEESRIAPPPTGSYSSRLTIYLEKVRAWRLTSQERLNATEAK